ncbi:NmrA family NAD(P)-binding protein [Dysgonomonas sp. 520]|uniref:NmrA family NAD(P)-binding protein n=1 Tax=Dysgonomonas sp. 520 TaxID=2302931 RepID=UPI0013D165DF|nr:NmrA family NAD(P)-binding protein [Dysgonomonas sp. 520]NDW10177.1 NAD-dependent epimerase/dehydratase family protein [Dysgonomonas sp. 520]
MNIIVGATGQVGSNLIGELKNSGFPVRAVVRNPDKLSDKTIEARTADLFHLEQLTEAFKGGTTVFVLTPENPTSNDIIEDTKQIVENYKRAIQVTGIKKVVALSCVGAHIDSNTGNILMSRILEQTLDELDIEKVFVRPSYYFSNWLMYVETMKQYGVLPSFFPEDLKVEMHSPIDLAKFIAKVMTETLTEKVYELTGQQKYSSLDVANIFSKLLNKNVSVQSIPQENWIETLMSVGFTENTAKNLSDMTQAVIDNKIVAEHPSNTVKLSTTLEKYIEEQLVG